MRVEFLPPQRKPLVIPSHLESGDLIGIMAPAGPLEEGSLNAGLEFFEQQGFRVVVGCNAAERLGYLAGSDHLRCHDLNGMLRAPEIKGILFARGGYGVMRILDSMDLSAIRQHPKLMVGMSDISALQLSLYHRCGLVTFAGPMVAGQVAGGLDPVSEESLTRSLLGPLHGMDLLPPQGAGVRILRSGLASGTLLGGCLSLVTALAGTPHFPDFTGTILFLEDVSEPLYRIDRMLTQLKLAGVLEKVSGMILGHFLGPDNTSIRADVE
ncbi:MAG: LD-carboxypeptidase, partial [Deltaproteobacteria bacterium]|nr:LD-carboxypeptidase [Deltaproteobacteria bacterium]